MRDIKFRAWSLKSKYYDLVDGFDLFIADGRLWEVNELSYMYSVFMSRSDVTDLYTVQQYTGLKDKNCKDIYEGDIVDGIASGVVVWDGIDGRWWVNGYEPCKDADFYERCDDSIDWRYEEVIGNMYETPELVEAK